MRAEDGTGIRQGAGDARKLPGWELPTLACGADTGHRHGGAATASRRRRRELYSVRRPPALDLRHPDRRPAVHGRQRLEP